MLDFKELPVTGDAFEQLIREILLSKGYEVYWSGKGPDGGKDLLAIESYKSILGEIKKIWLIQCKHNAHAGTAVNSRDLYNIVDSCGHHHANAFLLACSTYPSSKVVERLEGIKSNPKNDIDTTIWDAITIERHLSTSRSWSIAQRFFPISSTGKSLNITATEDPNYWIVNYEGYYFHLCNRIGSNNDTHFDSIDKRIEEIKTINLPENHQFRIRAIHYDDKNATYIWYLDYLYPHDEEIAVSFEDVQEYLGHELAWNDGQIYFFDILDYQIYQYSDHYDKDHYNYYKPYISTFRNGSNRYKYDVKYSNRTYTFQKYYANNDIEVNSEFDKLFQLFKRVSFIRVLGGKNSNIEALDKFYYQHDWREIIEKYNINDEAFFSAFIIFECNDFTKLVDLLNTFEQSVNEEFILRKKYIFLPEEGFEKEEDNLYELHFYIHPYTIKNKIFGRKYMNEYLNKIIAKLEDYLRLTPAST